MKTISIDIETFSSNSLKKCGVYKYAESDDFSILLSRNNVFFRRRWVLKEHEDQRKNEFILAFVVGSTDT